MKSSRRELAKIDYAEVFVLETSKKKKKSDQKLLSDLDLDDTHRPSLSLFFVLKIKSSSSSSSAAAENLFTAAGSVRVLFEGTARVGRSAGGE